jgi:ABC-type multidrug transport system ATPase subunit
MNIAVENLGKRYNREWIFRNFTFNFEQGKTYALLGPNGCGKSTLLQVLWGQIPQSAGNLQYKINSKEIEIADVFNHLSIATPYMDLIDEFTLTEMLRFHFKFKKSRNGISIEDLIRLLELEKSRNKTLNQFSSGMRQRVKLGLAFFSDAETVFLDEPTTNLDIASTDWYLNNLYNLPTSTTVIIASNQIHEYPVTAHKIEILSYK